MAIQKIQEMITAHSAIAELSGIPTPFQRVSLQYPIFGTLQFAIVPDHQKLLGGDRWGSGMSIRCEAMIKDREKGQMTPIHSFTPIGLGEMACPDPVRAAERVRQCLIHMATHEIDEMLLLDGHRYRDPHR